VLSVIRVSEDSRGVVLHEIEASSIGRLRSKPAYCSLKLEYHYGGDGKRLPGRCSKICEHGFIAVTNSFKIRFPILIIGGKK